MSEHTDPEIFDLEQVYDDEISPLMAQIIAICKRHRMPMLASFIFHYDEDDTVSTCDTVLQHEGREFRRLAQALSIIRGGGRGPALRVTARDAEGRVTADEVILP